MKLKVTIYNGAKGLTGEYNGAFLYFNENVRDIIGGYGKASAVIDQKKKTLTVIPDDNGHTISECHKHRWKIFVGGDEGKFLQKYAMKSYTNIKIENVTSDVHVLLRKMVIDLDDYEKKEKQEEITVKADVKETMTFAQAVSKMLHQQDEILERIKKLEEESE